MDERRRRNLLYIRSMATVLRKEVDQYGAESLQAGLRAVVMNEYLQRKLGFTYAQAEAMEYPEIIEYCNKELGEDGNEA